MTFETDQMIKLAKAIGIKPEDLDSLVHDIMSTKASNINNDGLESQVRFLMTEIGGESLWKEVQDIARHNGVKIEPAEEN